MKIKNITAQELLDSRGNPTVEAVITLENNIKTSAMVPSGASTGTHESLELRDNDNSRYFGKGVLKAVKNINEKIANNLIGININDQRILDQKMIKLDGTENKHKLGANAMLAVSMACVKAGAKAKNLKLYKYIHDLTNPKEKNPKKFLMPIPMMNVLNGGKHAIKSSDLQEFMIMPLGAPNIKEAIRWGAETFHSLAKIIKEQGWATTVGDEGGYAPSLKTNEKPLDLIIKAIEKAGYKPGEQISIALDPATSEFYENGNYILTTENKKLNSEQMIEIYNEWIKKYPIVSIEDGLAEDDWQGFKKQMNEMGNKIQIVGDDLLVTNPQRLKRAIKEKAVNSILIKLNQIGTVSETLETIKLAQENNITTIISHRSGETEDSFIADFAVGTNAGQIKTGSLSRSERICKYNQLMRIEKELGEKAKIAKFPNFSL